ncbi:glycerophosphodiester phosphodiesterase family protein [Georgenia sp. SYP-B2076]|uniref:glycerophosphodiester phosphodiesterase n=1 Tax=Georgenia sp. SYP-B2076 TaxID=2495881 RepID=UPI001F0C3C7D|nr:glycerophosphodiester phosphodiesterase family protein [Georgenia sp. SYP-B2076]
MSAAPAPLPVPPGGPAGDGVRAAPLVIAHRGNSSVAPENTLVALESAWRAGADMVEIDLQLTRDGVAVVIHDDTVDRTTDGTGRVDALDAARVAALDAGSWFAPGYTGERVPTAAELIGFLAARPGLGLLAELKGVWGAEDVRRVTDAAAAFGLAERIIVQSFEVTTVEALRDVAPALPRGLLIDAVPDDLPALCRRLAVMTCNPAGPLLAEEPDLVGALHDAGLRVMPWTLDESVHWDAAVALGVDGIITNRPDRLRGWLSAT